MLSGSQVNVTPARLNLNLDRPNYR